MSDPNIMVLFSTMYSYVETSITESVQGFGSGLVSFVAAPLALAATVYFLLLGISVLRGAIQTPMRELVFQAGKVGFVIAAAGAIGYSAFVVNVATNLPAEIISAGTGTPVTNPGTTFDKYVSDTGKLAKRMTDANAEIQKITSRGLTDFDTPLIKLRAMLICYACVALLYTFAFFSGAAGFCIVIFAKLSLSICVALAPLALACLLFDSSRWLFDGWLHQAVNYILLMVVMAIMTSFITGLQQHSMDGLLNAIGPPENFISHQGTIAILNTDLMVVATLACCAIYIVGTIFFFQSPSIAAGIAGGASSGGHGFLQTGANMLMNKMLYRQGNKGGGDKGGGGGGRNRVKDGR